jgi:hypothetical protein
VWEMRIGRDGGQDEEGRDDGGRGAAGVERRARGLGGRDFYRYMRLPIRLLCIWIGN